jgi:SAM-dependent methyltransferase
VLAKLPLTFSARVGQKVGDADSVLDVGCGSGDFILSLVSTERVRIGSLVGLDADAPSLQRARTLGIYSDVVRGDASRPPFRNHTFEVCLSTEVIEHLGKKEGWEFLSSLEAIARRRVVLSTPNGFIPYLPLDADNHGGRNELLEHRSGWSPEDFAGRSYSIEGSALAYVWGEKGLIRRVPKLLRPIPALVSYALSPLTARCLRFAASIICWKDLDLNGGTE